MKKTNQRLFYPQKVKRQLFCALVACAVCAIPVNAQSGTISLNKSNVSMHTIMQEVEGQSDYTFFYNDNQIKLDKKVSVKAQNATIEQVLAQMFKNSGYTYMHLQGLAQMGVRQLPAAPGQLTLYAPAGLRGAEICLSFPSVGATETLLLAAATAQGQTVLHGAAKEPEIVDLAAFLNVCGGCVEGAGTDTIRVQGKRCLAGCTPMRSNLQD